MAPLAADHRALLRPRWRGIRTGLRRYCDVGVPLLVTWPLFGWETPGLLGVTIVLMGVCDAVARSVRTFLLAGALSGPTCTVAVSRHYRSRYKMPDLEVAGLWPSGVVAGREPPMSVRVEDVGDPIDEGAFVEVRGDLRPGGWVVLVVDGQVVWPLRAVRQGLHPRRLGPYPFDDEDDEDDEDD